jgi:hypothetical protein
MFISQLFCLLHIVAKTHIGGKDSFSPRCVLMALFMIKSPSKPVSKDIECRINKKKKTHSFDLDIRFDPPPPPPPGPPNQEAVQLLLKS